MTIQMLHTVLHDGERIPAYEIVTGLPEAVAQALVASGAARVYSPEAEPAPAAPTKPEPEAPAPVAPAAPAAPVDAAPAAETGNAKAKGK